jgi:hypothetical protein
MGYQSQYPRAVARTLQQQCIRPRIFEKLYSFHHAQRFEWLRKKISSLQKQSVSILELGCADATSLDYVPVHANENGDERWEEKLLSWRPGHLIYTSY